MNILITGHDTFHNKGCQALIFTTTKILKDAFPDASFSVFSWEPEYDEQHFDDDSIECRFIKHRFQTGEFSRRNRFWFFLNYYLGLRTDRILRVKPSFYEAIKTSDLVVVSGGDILADYGEEAIKHYFFPIAVAIALKKSTYVFTQSITPYKKEETLRFAKFYLDKVSLITVRETLSFDYLKNIGIKAPFYLTADPAFTLRPCQDHRLKEIIQAEHLPGMNMNRPVIGVSVSETATKWSESSHDDFVKIMADVCDQMINRYKARIVFVPHVTYENDPSNDDRLVGRAVRSLMVNKQEVFLIEGDYSCSELKAIIGRCTLFIGARTHATVAATSMLVPTIALAYSVKALGIMEDVLDMDKCVCNIKSLNREELLRKAEYLMENREDVVNEMKNRLEKIRKRSMLNGELAKEMLTKRGG